MSGAKIEDEGLFIVQHQAWQQRMANATTANSVNEINPNPSIHS